MRVFARIHAIALMGLLVVLAALLLLVQHSQQARQTQLQSLRDAHLLRDLRTAAENHLATGLHIDQLGMLQQIIVREQAAFEEVLAIDVFTPSGTVLYSTDAGNRGSQAPSAWRTWLANSAQWQGQAPGLRQIGTRIEGDLGQAAGGIVVTFSTVAPMPTLAQWYARGQYALQWLALLVMAVLAVMGLLYLGLRQMCSPYVQVAQALRGQSIALAPSDAAAPLVQAAACQHAHWQAAQQRYQQGMRQLQELDHED